MTAVCFFMPALFRYLTHPEVQVDPALPVPSWGLSAIGRARVMALVAKGWLRGTTQVIASAERRWKRPNQLRSLWECGWKFAAPCTKMIALRLAICRQRSLKPSPTTLFAFPDTSIRGWERARDAQDRIVREAEVVLGRNNVGDVLFVGHGAVGTLLYYHYANVQINRVHDQPSGGGHYFAIKKAGREVAHGWRRMEDPP